MSLCNCTNIPWSTVYRSSFTHLTALFYTSYFMKGVSHMKNKKVKKILALCLSAALIASISTAGTTNVFAEAALADYMLEDTLEDGFNTNLSGLTWSNGIWEIDDEGLYSNGLNKGDCFLFSETFADNFIYTTDVKFLSDGGAASLVFRNPATDSSDNCYAVNIDNGNKKCKFWKWTKGNAGQLSNEIDAPESKDGIYTLKVVAVNNWISYYVNDVLVASTGDYTLTPDDKGQNTCVNEGYLGLLNWNSEVIFQNTYVTPIEEANDPTLTDITVASETGTVEAKPQFSANEPITIQYVKNDAETVDIQAAPLNDNAMITVTGPDGTVYEDGKGIPVEVGRNFISIASTTTAEDGAEATLTYKVDVHRRQDDTIYYNEPYRDQYHYSVKDGWANDPNGLVYYNGTYHLFHQFYDGTSWGPMHWYHVTSKDLIHWEEQPMAFYPDANGAMFSGCIVADETNCSGLFSSEAGGLVALITCDGNGQRIKLAYSEDEGQTWTKVDQIAADWTDDPLYVDAFRDPKVFKWEGKWFMVIAGGPLRIYSSENLVDWKCESTYQDLHTECPDMYPLQAEDGTIKWVLSRGGRLYKVGSFEEVDGAWKFIPDEAYEKEDAIMNFGRDSYAAMTFYVQDFGTSENPTIPDIMEINWMNTWDDYCNKIATAVGQDFNGTFNLILKEGITTEDGKYVLTQTPVEAYNSLRGEAAVDLQGVEVTADNTLLDDFSGECYEIVSTFYPAKDTAKVGFQVRKGATESTDIFYDVAEKTISIDRSQSGVQISQKFGEVNSQMVTPNEDGSITMHIYVDRASVEVFTKNDTVTGAAQIFPSLESLGASVIAEGGAATADITIYPMDSIWEKSDSDVPVVMTSNSAEETKLYVDGTASVKAILLPVSAPQDIQWTVADESVATLEANGTTAVITGHQKGETTVTAAAAADPELSKTFTVKILENNFETNAGEFEAVVGNWIVDDQTLMVSNQASNDFYMAKAPLEYSEYTLETKIKFTYGIINIFFAANSMDPFDNQAYAVQIAGGSQNARIFRFGGDTDKEGSMGKVISDDTYHDIKITKTMERVIVEVDGQECVNRKYRKLDPFFNENPYVGIGIWDGAMEIQTFNINPL